MMPSLSYNDTIAEKPAEPCRSGRLWMQPSLLMPNDKDSRAENDAVREPFITIDDLRQLAEDLATGLDQLSERKHPLAIRRGVGKGVSNMGAGEDSRTLNGAGRTYFLDVEQTREGKRYLRITESRKSEAGKFERNSVLVFPEDAAAFSKAATEMLAKLG
jgi:hypothetical protein